jgi:hypothetical protein
MTPTSKKNAPFTRVGGHSVVFDPLATEVSIIDRSGRSVWTKTNLETSKPIHWNCTDERGDTIQSGDYLCKMVYSDDKVSYLPFVIVAKA